MDMQHQIDNTQETSFLNAISIPLRRSFTLRAIQFGQRFIILSTTPTAMNALEQNPPLNFSVLRQGQINDLNVIEDVVHDSPDRREVVYVCRPPVENGENGFAYTAFIIRPEQNDRESRVNENLFREGLESSGIPFARVGCAIRLNTQAHLFSLIQRNYRFRPIRAGTVEQLQQFSELLNDAIYPRKIYVAATTQNVRNVLNRLCRTYNLNARPNDTNVGGFLYVVFERISEDDTPAIIQAYRNQSSNSSDEESAEDEENQDQNSDHESAADTGITDDIPFDSLNLGNHNHRKHIETVAIFPSGEALYKCTYTGCSHEWRE